MNLQTIFIRYPDQEACIAYLEKVRWAREAHCPHCGATDVARKQEKHRVGRWNCHSCNSSFNALSGSIFEKTKVPLQKWFLAINLMVNAKQNLSSYQLSHDLGLNQKTAWHMQQRIRVAMLTSEREMLQGIVGADEAHFSDTPRKSTKHNGNNSNHRELQDGRPDRGSRYSEGITDGRVASNIMASAVVDIQSNFADSRVPPLFAEVFQGYGRDQNSCSSAIINCRKCQVASGRHTNMIRDSWSLIQCVCYGLRQHCATKWISDYGRSRWPYNQDNILAVFKIFRREYFA